MLYPIMYKIEGKRVVVIGGGQVAFRKVRDLAQAGAFVVVIAPEINPQLEEFAFVNPSITIVKREYQNGDCAGAALVFSATNNSEVNHKVFEEASSLNIPINAVDDPDNSSFYVPSFFTRGSLLVAVSTGGASPAMAAKVRRLIEQSIPKDIEITLDALNEARTILKESYTNLTSGQRSELLKAIVTDEKLLEQTIKAFKSNTLHDFLKSLLHK
ncbi:MAG: bifunctional precorrin-2 dehydrogenase/sirohydrochlorin ferrochelatase [Spirochaetota bacterium]